MRGLNLRVYRRTLEGIALLWNKEVLDKEEAKDIRVIFEADDGKNKELDFKTSDQVETTLESDMTAPDNTIVMMISHEKNGIDPYKDVKLNIKFGSKISQEILVYSFGVLPPTEKDDKKQNQHIYGYVDGERKWAKLPLIRLKDGSLAVPIVVKKD